MNFLYRLVSYTQNEALVASNLVVENSTSIEKSTSNNALPSSNMPYQELELQKLHRFNFGLQIGKGHFYFMSKAMLNKQKQIESKYSLQEPSKPLSNDGFNDSSTTNSKDVEGGKSVGRGNGQSNNNGDDDKDKVWEEICIGFWKNFGANNRKQQCKGISIIQATNEKDLERIENAMDSTGIRIIMISEENESPQNSAPKSSSIDRYLQIAHTSRQNLEKLYFDKEYREEIWSRVVKAGNSHGEIAKSFASRVLSFQDISKTVPVVSKKIYHKLLNAFSWGKEDN